MKKKVKDFSQNLSYLFDEEPEVEELIFYCESLEDQIIDFQFEKDKNKELILLDMIREILKSCQAIEKQEIEHKRFGYEAPNYQETITDLKNYIINHCRDQKIWL